MSEKNSKVINYRISWALHQILEVLIEEDNKITMYSDYDFNASLMEVKLFPLALSNCHHLHSLSSWSTSLISTHISHFLAQIWTAIFSGVMAFLQKAGYRSILQSCYFYCPTCL